MDFARAYAKQSPKFRPAFDRCPSRIAVGVPGETNLIVGHRFDLQFRDIDQLIEPPGGMGSRLASMTTAVSR